MANVTEEHKPKAERGEYGKGTLLARPNGRWQIQYSDSSGRRRSESFSTELKATKALTKRLMQRDAGVLDVTNDTRVKMSGLAESYKLYAKNSAPKSYDWIELVWRVHLEPVFGHLNAGRITVDDIERYRAKRQDDEAAPSTINRECAVLRAIFGHALFGDKISRIPKFPKKLKEANPRSGFLSSEQYKALQTACPQTWLRALLAVAYNFGFRKSELLGLRVSQVDLRAKTIKLLPGETKSGHGRTVVMTADVLPLITECVNGKSPSDAVFTWGSGRPVKDFRQAWATMCGAAGVEILLHDFRRTAVRNLIRAGVSRDVARKISGHETDSVFSRYNITDESDLTDAARKLESSKLAAEVAANQ